MKDDILRTFGEQPTQCDCRIQTVTQEGFGLNILGTICINAVITDVGCNE